MANPRYTLNFEKPIHDLEHRLSELRELSREHRIDVSGEIKAIEAKIAKTRKAVFSNLSPWQRVQLARHPLRPFALDYIQSQFTQFEELHGDRIYGDDRALIGGTAFFRGKPVMILAQQKGRTTKENLERNFGMAHPEGYRKALRLARMAERFSLPLVCLIDTAGAYCGIQSEERHVAEAIAVNLREFSMLETPIVSIVIGEGGSGGALGIGVADAVLILENAYYSVISPEGCAAILWKDRASAPEAAEAMRLDAPHLKELGIVDEIIPEPLGGAHADTETAYRQFGEALGKQLRRLRATGTPKLLEKRYARFRALGRFETEALESPAEAESDPVASDFDAGERQSA